MVQLIWASQVALVVKNLPANTGGMRLRLDPWVGKICWRREWQPTAVFLPRESHGQRSLAGYSPAAATAESLQSCPTLCNPIVGSLPGSPIPGILQASTLEWVAISFSNA